MIIYWISLISAFGIFKKLSSPILIAILMGFFREKSMAAHLEIPLKFDLVIPLFVTLDFFSELFVSTHLWPTRSVNSLGMLSSISQHISSAVPLEFFRIFFLIYPVLSDFFP